MNEVVQWLRENWEVVWEYDTLLLLVASTAHYLNTELSTP